MQAVAFAFTSLLVDASPSVLDNKSSASRGRPIPRPPRPRSQRMASLRRFGVFPFLRRLVLGSVLGIILLAGGAARAQPPDQAADLLLGTAQKAYQEKNF